ncbi:hypothetical protein [Photobacterium nomapromontoriensis]|uniref:hypothetical protein n=1 Tax=Photobacterium nomapromontoriensis TaxID=2910237 RepID=UPI003D105855
MTIKVLSIGVCLQLVAFYVAFFSDVQGNIYFATLISVAAIGCITVIRSFTAPVCLLAGILVGLSLSHNDSDLQLLSDLEQRAASLFTSQPLQ